MLSKMHQFTHKCLSYIAHFRSIAIILIRPIANNSKYINDGNHFPKTRFNILISCLMIYHAAISSFLIQFYIHTYSKFNLPTNDYQQQGGKTFECLSKKVLPKEKDKSHKLIYRARFSQPQMPINKYHYYYCYYYCYLLSEQVYIRRSSNLFNFQK